MDLPTYTNIWRIEKRLYKLYDLRLPMPLPIVWIGVFVGVFVPWSLLLVLVGVPVEMPWHVLFLVPPGIVTWLSTRPVIEGKRLTELLESQLRYLGQPKAWYRLAPTSEPEAVTFSGRVWRTSPVRAKAKGPRKARQPQRKREGQRLTGPRQVRPAVAAAAAAAAQAPVAEPTRWGTRRGTAPALKAQLRQTTTSPAPGVASGAGRSEEALSGGSGRGQDQLLVPKPPTHEPFVSDTANNGTVTRKATSGKGGQGVDPEVVARDAAATETPDAETAFVGGTADLQDLQDLQDLGPDDRRIAGPEAEGGRGSRGEVSAEGGRGSRGEVSAEALAARETVVPIRTAESRKPAAGKPIDTEALRRLRKLAASADAPSDTVARAESERREGRHEDEVARDQHRKGQPPRLSPALVLPGTQRVWPPLNPNAKPVPRPAARKNEKPAGTGGETTPVGSTGAPSASHGVPPEISDASGATHEVSDAETVSQGASGSGNASSEAPGAGSSSDAPAPQDASSGAPVSQGGSSGAAVSQGASPKGRGAGGAPHDAPEVLGASSEGPEAQDASPEALDTQGVRSEASDAEHMPQEASDPRSAAHGVPEPMSDARGEAGEVPESASDAQGAAGEVPEPMSDAQGAAHEVPELASDAPGAGDAVPTAASDARGAAREVPEPRGAAHDVREDVVAQPGDEAQGPGGRHEEPDARGAAPKVPGPRGGAEVDDRDAPAGARAGVADEDVSPVAGGRGAEHGAAPGDLGAAAAEEPDVPAAEKRAQEGAAPMAERRTREGAAAVAEGQAREAAVPVSEERVQEEAAPVPVPRPGEGRVRRVESVVGRDSGGWRRIAQVVVGSGGVRTDGSEIDEARARAVFGGSRRVVVLGCTGGAGQSTTALMLGHTFARYRDDRVVAVDANTGGGTLTSKIQPETPETLTSLLSGLDRVSGYLTMRGYTTRTASGLEVISADSDAGAEQRLNDRSFFSDHRLGESMRLLDRHYKLAVIDPAAALAARLLPYADQLVLVVPASEEASEAVAMTYEWLDGHGCAELRRRAVMVVNGVSRRSMTDVEQAESVASGRCRAIVRVPWEDDLAPGGTEVVDPGQLRAAGRRAYLALAGVVVAGFAAQTVRPSEEELASDPPGTRIGER